MISKLYYAKPWLQELETKIVSKHQEGEMHLVVLEQTIFYPTGGGQPHDLGLINGIPLLDVFEKEGVIYHALEQLPKGDLASCVLDWPRRLDHMQQHSGQHLLSAILADQYGYSTESFHLGEDYCSIDISTPILAKEEQAEVELKANRLIFEDLPLFTYTVQPENLSDIQLRKMPDIAGPLRIVEIQGLDYSPCSGTHVEKLGQIGQVKIIRAEKYKNMTRLYFLCGQRAYDDYSQKQEILSSLGMLLSVPEVELKERIELELQRKRDLEKQLSELKLELIGFKAQEVVNDQKSPFYIHLPQASIEEAQQLARSILNLTEGSVVINLGERLVLTHNLPTGINFGQLVKEYAQPLGGRGGGSATSAQVYFGQSAQLQEFLDLLQNKFLN